MNDAGQEFGKETSHKDAEKRSSIEWEGIQKYLPDIIQNVTDNNKGESINNNPWVQSCLHGIANATPSIFTAFQSGKYLKIIGPPAALDKTLRNIRDKQGNILGGLADESGTIRGQTRFEKGAGSLNAAASAAVIFQILSVATSQYYLHNISTSLQNIENKINDINVKLESRQLGEIKAAIDIIDEIYSGNIRLINSTGCVEWQAPDKIEFWTRMANAERDLRSNIHALENEIMHHLKKISDKVRKDGERKRESFNQHREILDELKEFQNTSVVRYYLLALRGMMRWYQIVLSFDAHSWEVINKGRYDQMTKFVQKRNTFLNQLDSEYRFIIERPDGNSWRDNAIIGVKSHIAWESSGNKFFDLAFPPLGHAKHFYNKLKSSKNKLKSLLPIYGDANYEDNKWKLEFEKDRFKFASELKKSEVPLFSIIDQFSNLSKAFKTPQEFYLHPHLKDDQKRLALSIRES